MADKKLTIILYGGDRSLWQSGRAELRFLRFDSDGIEALWVKDSRGERPRKNVPLDGSIIEVGLDLQFDAAQVYGVQVTAPWHRPTGQLINRNTFLRQEGGVTVESEEAILRLMLVQRHPTSSDLDEGFRRLADQGSPFVQAGVGISEAQYLSFDPDAQKMALLNIESKLRASRVGGVPLLSYVTGVRHVSVDRVFLMMRPEAKNLVETSAEFASAAGHGSPSYAPHLPAHPDSWKQGLFPAGNLQLSFAASPEIWPPGSSGSQSFSVDVDIDLERGIKHWAEWLDNNVLNPGQKTDQTLVYVLLYSQGILPAHTLDPRPA